MQFLIRIFSTALLALGMIAAASAATAPFQATVTGNGPPMLFIPGLASSSGVFDSTVAHFKASHECHVLGLAGFAGVPAVPGPFVEPEVAAISDYIAAHHWSNLTLVGHSLGGFIALKIAIAHPELVSRLIILDALPALGAIQNPAITPEQLAAVSMGIRAQMESATKEQFLAQSHQSVARMVSRPEDTALVQTWGDASDRATVTIAMSELFGGDLRGSVARITAPTLVLGSWIAYQKYTTQDAVAQSYRAQYANLKGVDIEISDTARHFVMLDDPVWTNARMDAFLSRAP